MPGKAMVVIGIMLIVMSSVTPVQAQQVQDEKITVISTLQIFASIVKRIGGPYVNAEYIVPAGTDIHDYSLTHADVEKIRAADVVVLANSNFFSIDSRIKAVAQSKKILDFDDYNATIFAVGDMQHDYHGYWLYPENARGIASAVAHTLSVVDSQHRSYYMAGLEGFESELESSVRLSRHLVASAGMDGAGVILAVPGVLYVAKSLNLSVMGILSEGPNQFVSPENLAKYKEWIGSGKVSLVLNAENMGESRAGQVARELSRETGVKIAYVDIFSASNYTETLESNAAVVSAVPNIEQTSGASCNLVPYFIVLGGLMLITAVIAYFAYTYRRELLK